MEDRLTCESINLNMNTKVGVIHNGRLFIKMETTILKETNSEKSLKIHIR